MLKNKNLLILSHNYNSFIKDPVEILSNEFNRIYVLVRYNPFSELSQLPLKFLRSRKNTVKDI